MYVKLFEEQKKTKFNVIPQTSEKLIQNKNNIYENFISVNAFLFKFYLTFAEYFILRIINNLTKI